MKQVTKTRWCYDIIEVIWETFLLWGENSAKERIYPTKWKNHTIFCISQKQKQTCLTVTETPVHLKTQLWQTVQTHFLKTPHARKRRKTQVTLNNNNKPALFIQRRGGGHKLTWNWLDKLGTFPFLPPSRDLPAGFSLLSQSQRERTADQGQRLWPPTGVVNAASNLRGPRQLFNMGAWLTVCVNDGVPTVPVWTEEASAAKEWIQQTNVSLTSSLRALNEVTPCWEPQGLMLTRRGRSLSSNSKTTH